MSDHGPEDAPIQLFTHGTSGPVVIVLHGGPAAPGCARPLALGLANAFTVLEPWQRGSGDGPLTVARHVADLHEAIELHCAGQTPALVGESWGAMLALAYAAEHPDTAGPLALIGCGTFDTASRARLQATLRERQDGALQALLDSLPQRIPDPRERLAEHYRLTHSLYSYDPVEALDGVVDVEVDMQAHEETWQDMLRLQAEGVYPAAFAAITSPTIMLHGTYDPHPGRMTYETLGRHIPQLEYREWERCGHSPWEERQVRDEFLAYLRQWLRAAVAGKGS